jgi:hypothetical protein
VAGYDDPALRRFLSLARVLAKAKRRTRAGERPQQHRASYVGIMQADAFAGFNPLYDAKRRFFDRAVLSVGPRRMLLSPFRTWASHIMQLRAIRIGERHDDRLPPVRCSIPNSSNPSDDGKHRPHLDTH